MEGQGVSGPAPETCSNCGQLRVVGDASCGKCGYSYPADPSAQDAVPPATGWAARPIPKDSAKGPVRIIIAVLLVVIALLVVGVAQQLS